tara:strand:+ start:343 stop:669 length:327 start_codon:yes stop_codon:yes gene_type:complete
MEEETKYCKCCGTDKPLLEFTWQKNDKYVAGGRHLTTCKGCVGAARKQRYHSDAQFREKQLAYQKERYATDTDFRERLIEYSAAYYQGGRDALTTNQPVQDRAGRGTH